MAPKGPHMPKALRERIVVWKNEMGKSTTEMAELAGCCERTVRNILRYERDYGVVSNPFAKSRSGPRALDTGDMNYIASTLQTRLFFTSMKSKLLYKNIGTLMYL